MLFTVTACCITFLGGEALLNAHFGTGTGPLLFDRLRCTGNEANLLICDHRKIGVTGDSCSHNNDVGIRCQGIILLLLCKCVT